MRRPSRQQLLVRWTVLATVVAVASVLVTLRLTEPGPETAGPAAPTSTPGGVSDDQANEPRPSASTAPPTTVLVPTGAMVGDAGADGPVVGDGPVRTYRVEVEFGAGVDADVFAVDVERILSDPRGWTTADGIGIQRTTDGSRADLVVTLATPDTVDELCRPLATEGRVSCAKPGRAIVNAGRWHEGAAASRLGLDDYRSYLVSHEFGHLLGHNHESCPEPGALAPVMMQQTLGIGACRPNPWPAPDANAG